MMWSHQHIEDGTQTDYGLGRFFLQREPLIAGTAEGSRVLPRCWPLLQSEAM